MRTRAAFSGAAGFLASRWTPPLIDGSSVPRNGGRSAITPFDSDGEPCGCDNATLSSLEVAKRTDLFGAGTGDTHPSLREQIKSLSQGGDGHSLEINSSTRHLIEATFVLTVILVIYHASLWLRKASDSTLPRMLDKVGIKLSLGGRRLVWATTTVGVYIMGGIFVYGAFEQWPWMESVYFGLQVITTVGYGDSVPKHPMAKFFTCAYALLAVCLVGAALSEMLQVLVDGALEDAMESLVRKGKEKMEGMEQSRPNLVRQLHKAESILPAKHTGYGDFLRSLSMLLAVVLLGTFVFAVVEGKSYLDGFYFCMMTATTVGFGDVVPASYVGRLFNCFFILLSVGCLASTVASFSRAFLKHHEGELRIARKLTARRLQAMDFLKTGHVDRGEYLASVLVSNGLILAPPGQGPEDLIKEIFRQFEAMDTDGSGYLDEVDIQDIEGIPGSAD